MKNNIRIPVWMNIICNITDKTTKSIISKKTDVMYTHVSDIINVMKSNGWLTTLKKGRIQEISLTDQGLMIKESCEKILKIIKCE